LEAAAGSVALSLAGAVWADATAPASVEDLRDLSIDQLATIQVTSVAKRPQSLSDAPASIYVITHDAIMRSGAISLPEILRLAPNLDVVQVSASQYIITARGFSGNLNDQNFTNKLLVLIDGRSVYTPLYSGVYWDMQDVPPEDIERIEVISGPGATLWGANAVNGVINIVTRNATQTQGGVVDVAAGSLGSSVTAQYGGKVGEDLTYRLYVKTLNEEETLNADGSRAGDAWSKPQGGFRFDWTPTKADSVTFQGDGYAGAENQPGQPDQDISGGNFLTRWNHVSADGSDLQVEAYYDRADRTTAGTSDGFRLDTYDIEAQDAFSLGTRNDLVVGAGFRDSQYVINGTPTFYFVPGSRSLLLGDIFVQDTFSITDRLKLTGGLKLEDDPYSGLTDLPDLRLSWKPAEGLLLWSAVSRAIRSPTPFDRDVVEKIGPTVYLVGDPDFQPETLTAYQLGARAQVSPRLSFSISTFYNAYDQLKSIEITPVSFLPLRWGNLIKGDAYGAELWGEYRLASWWRMSASFDELQENFSFKPGASGLTGLAQVGDDPRHQATLRSSFDLAHGISLDGDLRYVSALPDPALPAYVELDGRLAWNATQHIQIGLAGLNLLHAYHFEFPASEGATAVPRTFLAEVRWHF
jgi:iron complex outermembrane receptor protein